MDTNFLKQFLPAVGAAVIFTTAVAIQVKRYHAPGSVKVVLTLLIPTFLVGLAFIAWMLIKFG